MKYAFGRDATVRWFPFIGQQAVTVSSEAPVIYVFSDTNQPDVARARLGTGAQGAPIVAWTLDGGAYRFTIPAAQLQDPDATSNIIERRFWVGITFTLQASGQQQTVIEPLEMTRVQGQQARVGVVAEQLLAEVPELNGYYTHETAQMIIDSALEIVKARLSTRGFEWAQIKNPERLHTGIKAQSFAMLYANQSRQLGDRFDVMAGRHTELANVLIDATRLEYDNDRDSLPDTTEHTGGYTLVNR